MFKDVCDWCGYEVLPLVDPLNHYILCNVCDPEAFSGRRIEQLHLPLLEGDTGTEVVNPTESESK